MLLNLKQNIERIVGGIAILVLSGLLINQALDARHWHKLSDNYEKLWGGEKSAHLQTKLNYIEAAQQARDADAANVKRVQSEQAAINKEQSNALEARLADARARAERLRQELASASGHPSGPGAAPVPSVPNAPGQPDQTSIEDRLLATEQAIQLDELIKWVTRQSHVEVSK